MEVSLELEWRGVAPSGRELNGGALDLTSHSSRVRLSRIWKLEFGGIRNDLLVNKHDVQYS